MSACTNGTLVEILSDSFSRILILGILDTSCRSANITTKKQMCQNKFLREEKSMKKVSSFSTQRRCSIPRDLQH